MPKVRIDDTLEMHYEDNDFTDPWLDSETIVIHHGNERSSRFWYRWVLPLARQYRVIRLDARGFGQSTLPPPDYSWSRQGFINDLKGLVDSLGVDKVHLIAETGGSLIALGYASQYPEKLKSVTVITLPFPAEKGDKGGPEDGVAGATKALEQSRAEVERIGMEAWVRSTMGIRLDPSREDPEYVEWFTKEMGKTHKEAAFGVYGALIGQDFSQGLSEVSVPTMVLSSEGDYAKHYFWPDEIVRLVPNARLEVVPGTTGFVQYSSPEGCIDRWKKFVSGLA